MSISRKLRSSCAALACAALMGHAPFTPPAVATTAVVYTVHLDHPSYRTQLGDPACATSCKALTDALADSMGQLLQSRFAFVTWTRTGSATDTVAFHWVEDPDYASLLRTNLEFEVISPARGFARRKFRLKFEQYREVNARNVKPQGWSPAVLSAEWMPRLSEVLRNPDLMKNIFTELPVDARVTFGATPQATVLVSYGAIGRSRTGLPPTFRVHAQVVDPLMGTTASALIHVDGCVTRTDLDGYACNVASIKYAGTDVVGSAAAAVAARATITVESVHLNDLLPPAVDSAARSMPTLPPGDDDA